LTWTINITGHDDLSGDEKAQLEQKIVDDAKALVSSFKDQEGNRVSSAMCTTNTTGSVNLLY
jgi:hypothetical protein